MAFKVLGSADNYFDYFKTKAKKLTEIIVDKRMVQSFLNGVMGDDVSTRGANCREEILQLFTKGKGNTGNNMWELYNGYVEWIDHERGKDDEKRMASAMVGSGFQLKAKSWDVAMSFVK